jgi:hypothetical protein
MSTELRRPFSHGFLLTEQELRRIFDIMLQQMKRITTANVVDVFELKYKNGVVAEKATLDEIISENNGGSWEIQELKMEVVSKRQDDEIRIAIEFRKLNSSTSKDNARRSIYYYILGDERDWVYLTSSQLDDRIVKIKQYPIFDGGFFTTFIGGVILLLSLPGSSIQGISIFPLGLFVSGLIIIGSIAAMYGFPPYNFCWGDYIKIFNQRRTVGRFIIVTVIVGILLSVVGGLIANFLTIK